MTIYYLGLLSLVCSIFIGGAGHAQVCVWAPFHWGSSMIQGLVDRAYSVIMFSICVYCTYLEFNSVRMLSCRVGVTLFLFTQDIPYPPVSLGIVYCF